MSIKSSKDESDYTFATSQDLPLQARIRLFKKELKEFDKMND